MSMNLHCKEVDLWQTPTHITYMCFEKVNSKGKIIQDNWKSILHRYILWLKQTLNGVYENQLEEMEKAETVAKHIVELKKYKKLHFYVM
jgi:hypothetical protein